jgi:hypothetical protein
MLLAAPAAHAGFPEEVKQTVPSGGYGTTGSSTIPAGAKSATITTKSVDPSVDKTFDKLTKVLSTGTRGQGVVFCAITFALVGNPDFDAPDAKNTAALSYLLLQACIEMALQLGRPAATARVSAAGCPRIDLAIPVKVTKVKGGYRLRGNGTAKRSKKSPLVVSCRRISHGVRMKLRPRSRSRTLRSVIGRQLTMGYVNPADNRPVKVKTTFAVK